MAREETRRPSKPWSLDCCFSFSCKKIPRKIPIRKKPSFARKIKKLATDQEWKLRGKVKIMIEVKLKVAKIKAYICEHALLHPPSLIPIVRMAGL